MEISDTVENLKKTYDLIKEGFPADIKDTGAYVDYVNKEYAKFTKTDTSELDEFDSVGLFTIDDIFDNSITMAIPLEAGFDAKKVKESLDALVHVSHDKKKDELAPVETENRFTYGNYDLQYDSSEGVLKISHGYSDKAEKRKVVLTVMRKMIKLAELYLTEAQKYATEDKPTTPKPEEKE